MAKMLDVLSQVLSAILGIVCRSTVHILLYFLLSRIFIQWFGLNTAISFFCANYCISKIIYFVQHFRLNTRLRKKKPEEKIFLDQLSWKSSSTTNPTEFETDWKCLLDDDRKNILSSIVVIPFHKSWLFFVIITIIDYQINNSNSSYIASLSRTISFLILLISGSAIRYQTLFERDRKKSLDFMVENNDQFERYIVYSQNTIPVASVGVQRTETGFLVQLYQLNSKFNDYFYDIANYTCRSLIERMKSYANENEQSICLIWSLPTCKNNWLHAIKKNQFALNNTYQDFSFMPFVYSYVEQYKYQQLPSEIVDDTKKDQ